MVLMKNSFTMMKKDSESINMVIWQVNFIPTYMNVSDTVPASFFQG